MSICLKPTRKKVTDLSKPASAPTQTDRESQYIEMLEANQGKILRICHAYAEHQAAAQDLFQEVAVQLWQAMDNFRGEAQLGTWVYRVALNVCLRASLKLNRKPQEKQHLEGLRFEPIGNSTTSSMEQAEAHKLLHQCIGQLNPTDRSIMVLFLEGLPYREIGEVTGLTENHIAVKIKRIKTKLYACLNEKGYER